MKKFDIPEVEIEKFQVETVLTTSIPSDPNPTLDDENLGEKT